MKKAKRFLTGLLSAALALSLCAMPAMADDGEGNAQTPTIKTSVSTIDKTKEGSITIYKYLHSTELIGSVDGTGEQQSVPNEATPLKDAGFTIYQVKTADELVAYYEAAGQPEAVTADSYFKSPDNKTAANLKDGIAAVEGKDGKTERKTNDKGFVKFADLSVGMYLVIETTTPDSVVKPVEPFLVSIPMTRVQDGDTAKEGQLKEWLYDVVVYPKNSSAKGDITLVKKGKTDGKENEIENLPNVIFKLQRYNANLTSEDKYDDYTVNGKCEFTTNGSGEITVQNLLKGKYRFVEIGYEDGKESGYIINNNVAYEFEINDKGQLVTPADATTNSDFVINNGNTMTVYNHKPDLVKDVAQRDTTKGSDTGNDTDYAVGDTVKYTLTIYVPENVAKLQTFKVVDTMNKDQLMHNLESVTISSKGADGQDVPFAENTDYTLTNTSSSDKKTSEITIDFKAGTSQDKLNAAAGKTITISYTATLQPGADTTTDGNVNEAHLDYSRKTDIKAGEPDNPYEIHDKAVVYTFKTGILKKGQDGKTEKLLNGVTFDLYKKYDKNTDKLKENTADTVIFGVNECKFLTAAEAKALGLNKTDAETEPKWFKVATLTTTGEGDEAGRATVSGLPDGEYKLVETMTNKGYNLLSGPVDANLTVDYATSWTVSNTFDRNGKLIKRDVKTTTFTNGTNEYTYAPITIINRKGFDLPTTGGFGTLLFSGIGVLLVVAGVGVLLSLKKKNRA